MIPQLDARRIRLFLLFAFGIAWLVALIVALTGGLQNSPEIVPGTGITLALVLIAFGYMWAPALANLLTRALTREGWKDSWLAPKFRENAWAWVLAWLLPASFVLLGATLYFRLFPQHFDASLGAIQELIQQAESSSGQAFPLDPQVLALMQVLQAVLLAPLINSLFTFGEEFGWRAYLQPKLMPLGFRRALLWSGVIWGLWHAPVIAMGHNYGLGYPGYPWLGILGMTWFTITVGVVLGWLTLRGKSVWPAVIGHASINGVAGAPLLFMGSGAEPNLLLGPLPIGVIAGLPWAIFAGWILWKREPERDD